MPTSTMEHSLPPIITIHRQESFKFLDDISSRAVALFTNPCFIKNIGARICARVFGEKQLVTEAIEEFTKKTMLNLRTEVQLHGLLSLDSCMESDANPDPREIHVHGEWNYHALKASTDDAATYRLHVFLGTIKLVHELFHCLTPALIDYRNEQRPDLTPLKETPPDMGRRGVTKIERERGEEGIRLVGDMGFAMEELLFDGRRLFHRPWSGGFHYMIEKLYLQEYDMTTFGTTNYDIDINSLWPIFDSPEKMFLLQDLSQFQSLRIEPPLSPKTSSISGSTRKRSSDSTEESPSKKILRQIFQSPSVGGLFADDDSEEEMSDDEPKNHLLNQWLPHDRKC